MVDGGNGLFGSSQKTLVMLLSQHLHPPVEGGILLVKEQALQERLNFALPICVCQNSIELKSKKKKSLWYCLETPVVFPGKLPEFRVTPTLSSLVAPSFISPGSHIGRTDFDPLGGRSLAKHFWEQLGEIWASALIGTLGWEDAEAGKIVRNLGMGEEFGAEECLGVAGE